MSNIIQVILLHDPYILILYTLLTHQAKHSCRKFYWMKFYINFHHKQHPTQLNDSDVEAFLNYLVNNRKVAAQTQVELSGSKQNQF